MAKKAQNDLKAKQKRQKIIAGVGGVLLVALLAFQVPRVMKQLNQKPPPLPGQVQPANGLPPTATTPLTAPTLGGTGGASTSPAAAQPKATGPAAALTVYELAPQPQDGQLTDLGRFVAKDPFVQQGPSDSSSGGSSSSSSDGGSSTPSTPTPTPVPTPTTTPSFPASSAKISVNGAPADTVPVGQDFPLASSNPPFHLLSATTTSARVTIADGSYADGRSAVTLRVGKSVTLMNTADGTKYTLLFEPPN